MSCPKKEVELILGCRNGVAVYKREKFLSDGTYDSSSDEYSDGLGSLGRTPGECQAAISQKDPEIVCMTNDGGETVVKGVVIFSYDGTNWTSTVNNLDGSVATGYTVIPCATANQVEEGEVRCDGGINIVPFYDVETDGAASANVAFWFNPVANAIVVPSGSQTPGACAISKIVQVPNCAGTLDDKLVDSITATYLLNQENKHTEVISDVLTAVFGGTVAFTYTAPTNVAISYAGVTLANDTIVGYRTDFGDGYNDVGPSPDHSYNADGAYEIKGYAITLSGNKVLLYAKEVTIASGVITYSGANPHTVARTYKVLVAKAFQDYCGALPVGTPYNADGSAYTLVGDFEVATPIIIDELEDNADYQAKDIVCKKEIFATHIKRIATPGVPANSVAYEMSNTIASTYGGANDATNTYIHLIYPVQSGSQLTPIGPQLTEYFGNPQNGVLFTDVATVQAMTDNALVQMGLSVGDAVYAVNTDNEPIWFLSPTAVAELGNSTFLHPYFGINDAHNGYDQKADVTNIAANSNILLGGGNGGCTPIQEIKEKDSCTGGETYRYIVEDGAGNLVPVTDIYPAFVEADVLHEPCKEPEVEIDLLKTNWLPICVNGTTTRYVAETSTVDNTTGLESTPVKIYKQGANGAISLTAPVGTITEGYCSVAGADVEFIVGCESQVLSLTATATPLSVTLGTTLNFTNPVSTLYTTPAVAYVDKVIVDWGDGEYFIGSPGLGGAQTHIPNVSLASGTYQARLYVSTLDGDIFQLATLGYTYNQATNAVVSTGLSTSSTFAYRYIRNLIQRINTTTNTITYQTDTGATTTIGAGNLFYANCKTPQEQTIEELVLSNGQPVYEVVATALVLTENSSQNRIIGAQALGATINTNPTFAGARDVTVYNQYNVTIAFEYTTTNNATFHRVNIPRGGTFSNILKRDDYTNEGTYTAGRIVFAYTAGAVGPVATPNEININWTT